jgi:hypothetical protein
VNWEEYGSCYDLFQILSQNLPAGNLWLISRSILKYTKVYLLLSELFLLEYAAAVMYCSGLLNKIYFPYNMAIKKKPQSKQSSFHFFYISFETE